MPWSIWTTRSPRVERLQLGEERVGVLAAFLAPHQPVAEQVLLGDEVELVVGEAGLERQDQRHGLALGRQPERFLPALGELHRCARLAEDRGDARAAALRIGGEQRALARLGQRP